jgi:hypothetical protein
MKPPFGPARHAGFFTLGIAIAVLVVCGGAAGGGRLLHQAAGSAAHGVAAGSDPRQVSSVARVDEPKEPSRGKRVSAVPAIPYDQFSD